jgi:hypothetical protein
MNNQNKEWIDEITDKYYWVEALSGWLLAVCLLGGFYLLFDNNQSYYGWILLKISFIFLFVTLFYKAIIYSFVYICIKIKFKKGVLKLKDPIGDATRKYVQERKLR